MAAVLSTSHVVFVWWDTCACCIGQSDRVGLADELFIVNIHFTHPVQPLIYLGQLQTWIKNEVIYKLILM